MNEATKSKGRLLLRPLLHLLVKLRVSANAVTLAAIPLSIGAAWAFAAGRFVIGGVLVALVGLCDSLDGELSRMTGTVSDIGAFVDSNVDRLSEALVLCGIFWYYQPVSRWYGLLVMLALVFSFMVSYVRARAEGLGRECKVGFFERPIRVIVLIAGALVLGRSYLPWAIGLIALGSLVTVVHRFTYVVRQRRRA